MIKLLDSFNYETSEVDWCEENYKHSKYIIEYYNTISNLSYIFLSFYGLYVFKDLNCKLYKKIFINLLIIGLSSIIFHSTLSLFGQVIDEFTIFILIMNTIIVLSQNIYLGKIVILLYLLFVYNIFYNIKFNLILLFFNGFILFYNLNNYFLSYKNHKKIVKYWNISKISMLFAIISWIIDKYFCNQIPSIEFHALWHLFSAISTFYIGVSLILIKNNKINNSFLLPLFYLK